MLLEIKDLTIPTLDQKCTIINKISLSVKEGEIHAVIGPNGSGKSTLAYAIMGLDNYKPTEGKIFFDGIDITNMDITERAKLGITLAWQEPARIDGLSVSNYISLGVKDKTDAKERIIESLKIVNLEPERYLNRYIDETLSGGERKRIELAATIAMRPRLIILDEPDSGFPYKIYLKELNRYDSNRGLFKHLQQN